MLASPLFPSFGWKLLTNHDSTWISIFKQNYIKYGNFLYFPLTS